ncbi:unnamed protein product [Hydatigera taeniaeformis]|uniref:histone acetyltransferase n=1 Tax=Hydatigena taeniaeformis TaxID=6205 RepID=A0A3P7F791_HYDTA|nr:unnamed protein product [Hydatigera taeniaeformis]
MSRLEGRLGTPERPLSEQGLLVYRRYWRWVLLSFLQPYRHKDVSFEGPSPPALFFSKCPIVPRWVVV